MPEWKTCSEADTFKEASNSKTQRYKCPDDARPVEAHPVNKSKKSRWNYMGDDKEKTRDSFREKLKESCQGVPEQQNP
jgi:hypothetical protein